MGYLIFLLSEIDPGISSLKPQECEWRYANLKDNNKNFHVILQVLE